MRRKAGFSFVRAALVLFNPAAPAAGWVCRAPDIILWPYLLLWRPELALSTQKSHLQFHNHSFEERC
ncbi:MAG TPA: hypothetical protein VF600_03720 [Abditibacteriaceae bacterium]